MHKYHKCTATMLTMVITFLHTDSDISAPSIFQKLMYDILKWTYTNNRSCRSDEPHFSQKAIQPKLSHTTLSLLNLQKNCGGIKWPAHRRKASRVEACWMPCRGVGVGGGGKSVTESMEHPLNQSLDLFNARLSTYPTLQRQSLEAQFCSKVALTWARLRFCLTLCMCVWACMCVGGAWNKLHSADWGNQAELVRPTSRHNTTWWSVQKLAEL